jgi:hypothetical protein
MRLHIATILLGVLLCGPVVAAEQPPDVRDLMTANQFHATGLDKLAPEQLTAFDAWLGGYSHPAVAGQAPDVRDLVSASQFHSIGLDKLTPEQLAAFNTWLAAYRPGNPGGGATVPAVATPAVAAAVPAPAAASAASNGKFGEEMLSSQELGEPDRIESSIVGTFNGWNGRTTFKLANGQIWQQADSSTFDVTLQNPKVLIKHLTLGYVLTVPGHGAGGSVFVRRIH